MVDILSHCDWFVIAGELFTKVELDREKKVVYDVPIVATDGGGRSGYTMVRVNVADQGDNRPLFKMQEYKANIYGSAEINSYVLQVIYTTHHLSKKPKYTDKYGSSYLP